MPFSRNTDLIYADGPAQDPHEPPKPDIRIVMKEIEAAIDAYSSGAGSVAKQTLAQLNADLVKAADTMAWVYADPVVANNGIYRKIGGSGTGSWTRILPLPYSFIVASDVGAGTANSIQATTSIPVSDNALIWMNIFESNTATPVTVAFNGGVPLTIKSNSGEDIGPDGLIAGMTLLGVISGPNFRLFSDEAIAAQIFAARDAAIEARDIAAGYASDAVSQGNVPIYATVAGMSAITVPIGINIIRLNGYWAADDKGGAKYRRVGSEPALAGKFQSAGGVWWEIDESEPNPRMFGAKGDGATVDTAAFFAAQARVASVPVPAGVYVVDGLAIDVTRFRGSEDAILLYTNGQRMALCNPGNADRLEQIYIQEIKAAPGATLTAPTTAQGLGICEGVAYMSQNVDTTGGSWSATSVTRISSFPVSRAVSDTVDLTISGGGTAPTAVVDLTLLGHGAGASVIREGGDLWLYSTVSCPPGDAVAEGLACNYGRGFTKTKWRGSLTSQADVVAYRGLKDVYSAEVCVSSDGKYLVFAGYRYLAVQRDAAYVGAVPHVTVYDRLVVESAGDITSLDPVYSFDIPYLQGMGDSVGSLAGVFCDGKIIYILNGGAQIVGARSVIMMSMDGAVIKGVICGGFASTHRNQFRKGQSGKLGFEFECEGLALHNDMLVTVSKFNVATPHKVVSYRGKNALPTKAVAAGVPPTQIGFWARTEAPATEAWNSALTYNAVTGVIHHKFLTALVPADRYDRPHGLADGLYDDQQAPAYNGLYGDDLGYVVYTHFCVGQYDRNTDTVWPIFERRSTGDGRLYDTDQMKSGTAWDTTSFFARESYDYDGGLTLSGGPSVGKAATLELGNDRNTGSGDRYATLWAAGVRKMLWGATTLTYSTFSPNATATLDLGTTGARFNNIYLSNNPNVSSDANLKQDIERADDVEEGALLRVARRLAKAGVVKRYKIKTDVVANGVKEAAWQVGVIAQEIVEHFEAEGLDPEDYDVVSYNTWDAQEEEVDRETGEVLHPAREAGGAHSVNYAQLEMLLLSVVMKDLYRTNP
ncbi:tail fiber domain-containing protein [Shinella sp. M27]|uniref:tail fiber domain-containing protein n=1 Tax=Shinella sp. M27 TaxID=3368614 RepID=UPI003B9E2317